MALRSRSGTYNFLGRTVSLWKASGSWHTPAAFSTSRPSHAQETIFVTGGQGFLGGWILKHLLEEPSPPRIFSLDWQKDDHLLSQILSPSQISSVSRIFGDVADSDFISSTVSSIRPDYILHLAGLQIPTCKVNPILGAKVNVIGTLNLFEACKQLKKQHGHEVQCMAYASSAAVVGPKNDYPLGHKIKDDVWDKRHVPRTHYGVFKTANEGAAKIYWQEDQFRSIGIRPLTVYGIGREIGMTSGPTKAIKYLLMKYRGMSLGSPAGIKSPQGKYEISFTGKTSFNYVEDVAQIFIRAARSRPSGAPSVNIAGQVMTVETEFLETLEKVFNVYVKESQAGPAGKVKVREHIECVGGELPLAYEFEETLLEKVLKEGNQGERVPFTPLAQALPKILRGFDAQRTQGILLSKDL